MHLIGLEEVELWWEGSLDGEAANEVFLGEAWGFGDTAGVLNGLGEALSDIIELLIEVDVGLVSDEVGTSLRVCFAVVDFLSSP